MNTDFIIQLMIMMKRIWIALSFAIILFPSVLFAQPHLLDVTINNQPDNPVVVGTVSGDRFTPVDTLELEQLTEGESVESNAVLQGTIQPLASNSQMKKITWQFPKNAVQGMYRLVFGQTTYARVMGEAPQQLDFIFNNENVVFETDFKDPFKNLMVVQSEENRVWFDFLQKDAELKNHLDLLKKEVDYFQERVAAAKFSQGAVNGADLQELEKQAAQKANFWNQLQMERDRFILKTVAESDGLLASKYISVFREPLQDGFLSQQERLGVYQQEFFRHIDFFDESLMHSPVLTDKIFDYLVTFNQRDFNQEQRETAYMSAVDGVMRQIEPLNPGTQNNNPVYEFVLNYLVNGFEQLNMENVLTYIAANYSENLCETDEKTTLERKLAFQNMKPGNYAPDFTMNDQRGEPVTLSHVLKPKNLLLFWASWCPHCNEMLPQLKAWRRQFQATELEIIAISLDTSKSEWQQAVRDSRFDEFFNLSDLKEWNSEAAQKYNVYATPTMFVIDNNLRILAKPASMKELMEYFGK